MEYTTTLIADYYIPDSQPTYYPQPTYQTPPQQGWICPKCGKVWPPNQTILAGCYDCNAKLDADKNYEAHIRAEYKRLNLDD